MRQFPMSGELDAIALEEIGRFTQPVQTATTGGEPHDEAARSSVAGLLVAGEDMNVPHTEALVTTAVREGESDTTGDTEGSIFRPALRRIHSTQTTRAKAG